MRFQGRTDVPLNDEGRAEALALADSFRGRHFDGVWSSPLTRSVETARRAVGEPIVDQRLTEFDFGELEGRVWADVPAEVQAALLSFDDFAAPGGESVTQLRERIHDFLSDLPPGDHVVFTHGGVMHALLREIGRDRALPPGAVVRWDVSGASGGGIPDPS